MGAAPMAYVLWTRFLRHAPSHPDWPDRDRFVLSAGHASMLLYSLLHLTGYDLSLDDLKQFRQWGSRTPGHPEHGLTPGVEATTGPLGQGFANAVGMAIAERRLAHEINRPGHELVDHWTYVLASDGDLQEGIASEAASLAGHLRLGKLVVLYDDNRIQLDGPTDMAWSEDAPKRFDAYGWDVARVEDGNDLAAIEAAIAGARTNDRPSLIAVRTHIGFGSPNKQDSQKAHGSAARRGRGPPDEAGATAGTRTRTSSSRTRWPRSMRPGRRRRATSARRGVGAAARGLRGRVPGGGARAPTAARGRAPRRRASTASRPTRSARSSRRGRRARRRSRRSAGPVPELFGGSADLSESNLTAREGRRRLRAGRARTEPLVRRPRARDGRRRQRHRLPRRVHPVRGHVPQLQRLHARLACGSRRSRACM